MSRAFDDAAVEALLGAYALDACDADEAAAVESLLARRPDLAREAERLANAAAWIGAAEALEAPSSMRDSVLTRARPSGFGGGRRAATRLSRVDGSSRRDDREPRPR
jgi:anti-sigma factor RsiW